MADSKTKVVIDVDDKALDAAKKKLNSMSKQTIDIKINVSDNATKSLNALQTKFQQSGALAGQSFAAGVDQSLNNIQAKFNALQLQATQLQQNNSTSSASPDNGFAKGLVADGIKAVGIFSSLMNTLGYIRELSGKESVPNLSKHLA